MLKTMNFVFRIIQDSTHEIYEVCKGQDLIVVSHSQMGATEAEALGIPIVNVTLQKEMIPEKRKPQTLKDKLLGGMIGKQMAKPYNKIRKVYGLAPVKASDEKLVQFLESGDKPVILALGAMSFEDTSEKDKLDMFVNAFQRAGCRAVGCRYYKIIRAKKGVKRKMSDMNIEKSIDATRKGFEDSFSSGVFYNKQTQDSGHLEQILRFLPIKSDMTILDLGAGSGYLSFPIAKENRSCKVVGLDIVSKALEVNRERADRENLSNLSFVSYDGIDFPFADASFDMVITRYALHHFPDIEHSIGEVSRVLKKNGSFFVSDPCPNDCDSSRFVDEYMQMKKDGHIKFYTKKEWEDICSEFGMEMSDFFESSIRFPRKRDTAYGFDELLKKHEQSIIDSYDLVVTDTEIYVTERVNNILFSK